jgi:PAS domain S-box-containing protein/diguanylate cyclase (GGDEF)-like protein
MTDSRTEENVRHSEKRYRSLVDAMAELVWTTDCAGQMIEDQPGWQAYTGQTSEEIQGTGWLGAVHPDLRSEAASAWACAISLNSPFEAEWRLRRRDGEHRYFSIRAAPVRAPNKRIREWIGCAIDITDRKRAEEELRRLHATAGTALAQLELQGCEMRILKNLSDTLQACNSREEAYPFIALAATELFAGSSGALAIPAARTRELLETAIEWGEDPGMKADFAIEDCWALRRGRIHEPGPGTICHHFSSEPNGPYACVPLAVRGEVSGLLSFRPAEAQALDQERRSAFSLFGNAIALGLSMLQLRESLKNHSIRDPVTGLAGPEFSDAVLDREIRRAVHQGKSVSLAVLDLQGFSQVEAAYEQRAADSLLQEMGTLLRSTLGPLDLVARYEREQLLLVLMDDDRHGQEPSTPVARLRRLCLEIQKKAFTYQGAALPPVTVSAGLAESPVHGSTSEELKRAANRALHAAKLAGPGRIETYSSFDLASVGR